MTNPAPNHVVKSINPSTGAASYAEVAFVNLTSHITGLRQAGVPEANIFVFTPADLAITTATIIAINGLPI